MNLYIIHQNLENFLEMRWGRKCRLYRVCFAKWK